MNTTTTFYFRLLFYSGPNDWFSHLLLRGRESHGQSQSHSRAPYCGYQKFLRMAMIEARQPGGGYYSIVNDGPYVGPYEKKVEMDHKAKEKWVGQSFRLHVGPATTRIKQQSGLRHADGPYRDPNPLCADKVDRRKFINPERTWRQ